MNEFLASEFDSIRDFLKPRIEQNTKIVSLKLSDVQNQNVRAFFSRHEFCQRWLSELSVAGWARLALDCECHTLSEMEEAYVDTEIGDALIENQYFCFAITSGGGFWGVSMKDGHVAKLIGYPSTETGDLIVDKTWDDFASLISQIKTNNLAE